jgi:hypothetical protein
MRHVDLGPLNRFGRLDSDIPEEVTDFSESSATSSASCEASMSASCFCCKRSILPVDQILR